jgi:hypothetical protein
MKDEGGRRQEAGRVTKASIIHDQPYQIDWGSILLGLPPASYLLLPSSLIPHPSSLKSGGEGGIRTHGTRKGTTVFETARFNHSRTSPISFFI